MANGRTVESLFRDCRKCNGHIGVPITFLANFCEEQFTIIGIGSDVPKTMEHVAYKDKGIICYEKNGVAVYTYPYTVSERKVGNSLRIIKNGIPQATPYNRILIQRKPTPKE